MKKLFQINFDKKNNSLYEEKNTCIIQDKIGDLHIISIKINHQKYYKNINDK